MVSLGQVLKGLECQAKGFGLDSLRLRELSAEPYCHWGHLRNHGSIFGCHRDGDMPGISRGPQVPNLHSNNHPNHSYPPHLADVHVSDKPVYNQSLEPRTKFECMYKQKIYIFFVWLIPIAFFRSVTVLYQGRF